MTLVDSPTFERDGHAILGEFFELLRLPNVTGHDHELEQHAGAIVELFADTGADLTIHRRPGASPIVLGRLDVDPALPTVGIYVHYDGQPVNEPDWRSDPFDPVVKRSTEATTEPISAAVEDRSLRVFARASADDRAPLIALATALRQVRRLGRAPSVNLVFCFDGEEERGSPNLSGYLAEHRHDLDADHWWICDGPVHQSGRPQIVCGVRGYVGLELTVFGPHVELHSGHYGNWVPNPAQTLVEILHTFKHDGQVEIEGFDACATPITTSDRRAIGQLPVSEPRLLQELGVAAPERDVPLFESVLTSSFNIRGLRAGTVAPETRNIIPAEAKASIDMRLATGVQPEDAVEQVMVHLSTIGVHVVDHPPTAEERARHQRIVQVVPEIAYPGFRVDTASPSVDRTRRIIESTTGDEPVVVPSLGGSVPFHHLHAVLGVDGIVVPIANHDNNQHSSNENLTIDNLVYGIELFQTLLTSDHPG